MLVGIHLPHPAAQAYPSPNLYDPLLTLSWATAATDTIGIGIGITVVSQHEPLWLASDLGAWLRSMEQLAELVLP